MAVALACLAGCAGHRAPPPSTDIEEAGFRDAVRVLASDEFEGRAPGTVGEQKTVAFLVGAFRKLGLKPANGDSYLQQVPLVETVAGEDAALSITGGKAAAPLIYRRDMVIWTPQPVAESALHHSEMVFVGYGIVAPEYQWNDYEHIDVHGKTVVVLVNDPGYGSKDPRLFKGNAETYYGRWTYKLEEAARQGAAGVLLIHDSAAAGQAWSVVVNDHARAQLALASDEGNPGSPAIEGWISSAAAGALFTQAGLDFGTSSAAAARPGFRPVEMGLYADAAVHNTVRRFSSPNVIGIWPGGSRKHEYVMYTAHWDHLGRQPPQQGGAVFNGAVDDASGVAGLLMLAQSFARTQPVTDRSIVFAAFTAEDVALLGSSYYVAHPVLPLRDTAAVLNLDTLHVGGPSRDVMLFGFGNSELEDYVRDAAQLQGREVHPDPNPELGLYYQSTQFTFARDGVPALDAKAGLDDAARGPVWGQAQLDEYRAHRYHQSADTYSADWDVRGTLQDLALYYDVGNRLARSRHFPRWYPNSEFRSSRRRIQNPGD